MEDGVSIRYTRYVRVFILDEYLTMTLNVVTLVGRAGRDPEVKYFESGAVVCSFSLAVDRRSRSSDEPDWFELKIWGKTAQVAADYVRKGKQVGIVGALSFEHWIDRNTGASRSKPVIQVSTLELLGSKGDMMDPSQMPNANDEF
ncbi:MAG: hypothetical protein RLZZ435_200 [Cyanobacteriota bacterium]|jgi:single-strand DNA-binding protein